MSKLTKEQIAINKRRQAYMKAAGYNVPQDGSWGPWQQKIWDKLSTKQKQYDTTLMGFAQGMWDKLTGNDTVKYDPTDSGTVRTWSPDNVDWGKTRRSQNKVVNAVSGTWAPIAAIAGLPALVTAAGTSIPAVTASVVGGAIGGAAVDAASKAITGHDIGTNIAMYTPLSPDLGEWINPGYSWGGRYGGFVGNNVANRGRYFLKYVYPAGYEGHGKEMLTAFSKLFYEKPPTFFNGEKPVWYAARVAKYKDPAVAENRFQNGLVWAGIPEKEAAHPMYIQNADGSYRLNEDGASGFLGLGFDAEDIPRAAPGEKVVKLDTFTSGGVGGEHSDYIGLDKVGKTSLMQFNDRQKLNPQWMLASKIKNTFGINDNSKTGKFIDFFGGMPLDRIVGLKPFTIKQNYLHDGSDIFPIYKDPASVSNLGLPQFGSGINR